MTAGRCSRCQAYSVVEGRCVHGCADFARPHATRRSLESRARRQVKQATAPIGMSARNANAPTRGRW